MNSVSVGALGERACVKYLRRRFYKIAATDFKTVFGEIDIIAYKGKTIVFAEVKTRGENSRGAPREAVNSEKLYRIRKTAEYFMKSYKVSLQPRLDVFEVYIKSRKNKIGIDRIVHLKGVY